MATLSLRARLTLWYTIVLVLVLCLFGAQVIWGQRQVSIRRVDRELASLSATVEKVIKEELREGVGPAHAAEEATATLTLGGHAIALLDPRGAPIAANWNGLAVGEVPPAAQAGPVVWTTKTAKGAWRIRAQPKSFEGTPFIVLVGSSLADLRREQGEILEAMEIAIPIVLLLAGGGGFWLASLGLRPITDMAQQASAISTGGVDELGPVVRKDELGQLARSFNGLLARLREALRTQRQFMADASHELRTPISIVRTASEVALSRNSRDEADYREALAIVGDQSRRLGRLVDDMLVLARADAGGYRLRAVDLYLDELVSECCHALHVLSTERQVRVCVDAKTEVPFRGDEDLLRQLVLNVLQNAVQHTPAGASVSVSVQREQDGAAIRITDSGPGIPPEYHSRIFDRFVQLDDARRSAGAGLGLPIAKWIAEAHHGSLVLERSGPTGSTFLIGLKPLP